jgi:DNA-binding CsgD family transcriptional regulator
MTGSRPSTLLTKASSQNPYGLTSAELGVVELLRRGLAGRDAWDRWQMDRATFRRHTESIVRKLGAKNAAHMQHLIGTLPGHPEHSSDVVYLDDLAAMRGAPSAGWTPRNRTRVIFDDVVFVE